MSEEPKPEFDHARAASLVGKHVLIGLSYYDHKENLLERKQIHGKIISADERRGIAVELEGEHQGEQFWLPPDLRPFQEARPGEYRLHSTGEVLANPDLVCVWSITKPPPEDGA
jgi:hypothetical protein